MLTSEPKQIRVSYIISTRNRARHLDKALANVREFITPDDELIVIDGASTDHTAEIVKQHADIVALFRSEPDGGEAHGYNKAILECRGRYIKVLTDDDYIYPDAMKLAIDVMESHPDVDAILCGGETWHVEDFTGRATLYASLHLPQPLRLTQNLDHIFTYVSCGLGLILHRRVIARVGLFNTACIAVDTDYMARLIAAGVDFRYLDVKLFRHFQYGHSGQNRWDECRRDRIRAILTNRKWQDLFRSSTYPPTAISEVLGLNVLPGGGALMRWIRGGELLRQWRMLRPVLYTGGACFAFAEKSARYLRRVLTSARRRKDNRVDRVDPVWDQSLR